MSDERTDLHDDGLPLDPEKRRAAVAAQFDEFRESIEALTTPTVATDQPPTAGELLARFKHDVIRITLSEPYRKVGGVVAVGLRQLDEAFMRRIVSAESDLLAEVLAGIDEMRENVRRVGEEAARVRDAIQTPPTTH